MDIIAIGAAKRAINQAVSGLYKPAGAIAFADLPTPGNSNLGFTYTVEDAFTSDNRFTDYDSTTQTGHDFPAGSEVAVIVTGTAESPVYKYNVMGGIMDGYATKTETAQYPISGTVSGDDISVTGTADANVQKLTVYGRSRVSKNLLNYDVWKATSIIHGTAVWENNGVTLTATANDCYTMFYGTDFPAAAKVPVKENQIITLSWNESTDTPGDIYIFPNGELTGYVQASNSETKQLSYTVPNGVTFITYRFGVATSGNTISYKNIQLELGSTPTPYEPYGEIYSIGDGGSLTITTTDGTASSTATLTTGLPLCGIPVNSGETYTDGDDVKWLADEMNDEGVVKRFGIVDLGDLTWEYDISVPRFISTNQSEMRAPASNDIKPNIISDIYSTVSFNILYNDKPDFSISIGMTGTLSITNSSYTDTTAFKSAMVGHKIIYELATPTTTTLTPAEKSALLNLKTFDNTTNLSITDDPFVDFGYLKNTENGKAVEQAAENAIAQIPFIAGSWITDIPEMHRNIFRGQSLGSSVTAAQLAAIQDGSFDGLYVGDYWTINNVVWRIVDIDHYLGKGASWQITDHHLVIMPDEPLYTIAMGSTSYASVRSTVLADAKTAVSAAFPNLVIPYSEYFGAQTTDDSEVEVPDDISITETAKSRYSASDDTVITVSNQQFSLFRLVSKFINSATTYWTRNQYIGNSSLCVTIDYSGVEGARQPSEALGIRPYFLIGVSTHTGE